MARKSATIEHLEKLVEWSGGRPTFCRLTGVSPQNLSSYLSGTKTVSWKWLRSATKWAFVDTKAIRARDLIQALKAADEGLTNDSRVADFLGLTPARLSQWRKRNSILTPRQIISALNRVSDRAQLTAFEGAIAPIVEFYPIERTSSRGRTKWEILPTDKKRYPRFNGLRQFLEENRGIYFFYNSEGEVLYSGKTERQTLWKEINLAFNRERTSHTAHLVTHPSQGKSFKPGWEKLRQPRKQTIFLCDVASFFSAYYVKDELIAPIEALVVRAVCNDISNVRMERFKFD